MGKKNILLNWESSRADLMEPFIALKEDFNFSVIWYKNPPDHPQNHPFHEYYFGDFQTPYQLLRKTKPDKIIFFGIHSFPQIALNAAAKNRRIPTYTMHHGIYSNNLLDFLKSKWDMGVGKKRKIFNSSSSLLFYLSALKLKNIFNLPCYLIFPFLYYKYGSISALKKCVFDLRLPDKYIQLSPHNANAYRQMDNYPSEDKYFYIGHPGFDKFLKQIEQEKKESIDPIKKRYWILIDFPNISSNIGFKSMGVEGKLNFYKRLSAFAKKEGCRLKIKLHPYGYTSEYNYQDENIDLLKDTDIYHQIYHSEKCFSFYSSLIIPVIYLKHHCIVFDVGLKLTLLDELVSLGVVTKIPANDFNLEEILINGNQMKNESYDVFINRYLYFTDGNSIDRLKSILLSDEVV